MLVPCTKRTRLNQAASGNGAITILLHAGRFGRAVPEPQWLAKSHEQ
jgi:hypothetical protein